MDTPLRHVVGAQRAARDYAALLAVAAQDAARAGTSVCVFIQPGTIRLHTLGRPGWPADVPCVASVAPCGRVVWCADFTAARGAPWA